MKAIYKYELKNEVTLPISAQILHYGADPRGVLCLWAVVNTDEEKTKTLEFELVGTGWPLDEMFEQYGVSHEFVTTINDGPYMWHIFRKHTYDCKITLDEEMLADLTRWELKYNGIDKNSL